MQINMKRFDLRLLGFSLCLVFLLCPTVFANEHDDGGQRRLEGVWRVTGMMKAGQIQPFEGDTTYSFQQGTLEIDAPPQPDGQMVYHVDSDVSPHRLVLRWDSSIDAERSEMIYGFDADHLWICYAPPGQPRPTSILHFRGFPNLRTNWS